EAVLDDAQALAQRSERDVFLARRIGGIERVDELARLLGGDGNIRDEQGLVRRRAWHLDPSEHPGREQPVAIGENRAPADRAGRLADGIVDEVDLALMPEVGFT